MTAVWGLGGVRVSDNSTIPGRNQMVAIAANEKGQRHCAGAEPGREHDGPHSH